MYNSSDQYHKPQRAWINWKSLVRFSEASQFDTLPTPQPTKSSTWGKKCEVPPSKRLRWNDSIKEATEAKSVGKHVRLEKYIIFKQHQLYSPEASFILAAAAKPKSTPNSTTAPN